MSYLPELFESRDYATTIKVLDSMAGEAQGPALASLLCNRALCYQKMDLHRKALKNYDEALKAHETFARAHMGRAKALVALGRPKEAQAAWRAAVEGFSPADDLQLAEDAYRFMREPQACLSPGKQAPPPPSPQQPSPPQQQQQATPPAQPRAAATQAANGATPSPPQQPARPAPQPAPQPQPQQQQQRVQPAPASLQRAPPPDAAAAVALAVGHINAGRVDQALKILDEVIAASPSPNVGAHISRGTARALKRELKGAIADFSAAIAVYPSYGDAWKRRGQARSADGDREGALQDFRRAAELTPDAKGKAEVLFERGVVLKGTRDLRRAASELRASLRLDAGCAQAWQQLGLCLTGLGDIGDACAAYHKALELDRGSLDAWFHLAQAHKEAAHVAEAEAAFKQVFKLMRPSAQNTHMHRVYAHMKQGLGEHTAAIRALDKALETAEGGGRIDCLFLRGACQHALGYHARAVADYTQAFLVADEGLPEETRQQQVLAFFQKELAAYARGRLDDAVAAFSMDHDIAPLFKELWCKKVPPTQAQLPECQASLQRPPRPASEPPPPRPDAGALARLTAAADALGALLQNRHQGFLPNARQQRMGGLAAIELAQAVRALVAARKAGREVGVRGAGASVSRAPHAYGWRDAMDVVVKWRQLSEPNDQVIWVDLLTRSEFEAGFGSHTPMFSGQTKCVRYYMNFARALRLLQELLLKEQRAFDAATQPIPLGSASTQEAIRSAKTAGDLWNAVGQDSWAVVPIASLRRPGRTLEGTRLTTVRVPDQPDAYEMSIRTPVTPPRWAEFDEELAALWEQLLGALAAGEKPAFARLALHFAYYWYNFMPLARGTAVSGYIALIGLFLAADMPVTAPIPKDYQVDWEAILQRTPQEFYASLEPWFLPPQARAAAPAAAAAAGEGAAAGAADGSPAQSQGEQAPAAGPSAAEERLRALCADLPAVSELIPTLRNRLEALNGPELPRI